MKLIINNDVLNYNDKKMLIEFLKSSGPITIEVIKSDSNEEVIVFSNDPVEE